jgi:hypothetical protein
LLDELPDFFFWPEFAWLSMDIEIATKSKCGMCGGAQVHFRGQHMISYYIEG